MACPARGKLFWQRIAGGVADSQEGFFSLLFFVLVCCFLCVAVGTDREFLELLTFLNLRSTNCPFSWLAEMNVISSSAYNWFVSPCWMTQTSKREKRKEGEKNNIHKKQTAQQQA